MTTNCPPVSVRAHVLTNAKMAVTGAIRLFAKLNFVLIMSKMPITKTALLGLKIYTSGVWPGLTSVFLVIS